MTDFETTKYDAPADDFALEDILAEYGGGRGQKLMRDVEREVDPLEELRPRRERPLPETPKKTPPEPPKEEYPKAPKPVTLEDVVGSTVDAVMEENREPLLKPKRGLFSRRRIEETEQLYDKAEEEPEEEEEEEPIPPEPDFHEAVTEFRLGWQNARSTILPALLLALAPTAVLAAEQYGGVVIPYWSDDLRIRAGVLLACLAVMALLCRVVFVKAIAQLRQRRCTVEVLAAASCMVSALDCVMCLLPLARTAVTPYASAALLTLVFAQLGILWERRGMYDTFRAASIDEEPPYLVTDTDQGACKQRGAVTGFYTTATQPDHSSLWQAALLPVVLIGSFVFAILSSFGQGRDADFLLNWSAIVTAGATLALPLSWALPWAQLTRHLQKAGCTLAGWTGAEKISRSRSVIMTDVDLFPPGTIQLNGVKVFGEEMRTAVTHAATLAHTAGSGLERLFDGLLRSELGSYEKVDDFSFYAEGGWSATIRGETVLMGTAPFMRKMDVRLPGDINLKTGVFLAVDGQLIAVFAVKYNASENVDYALRMMRRSKITPILAARDPNITPLLLQRKFHKGVKVKFPDITSRVALSEAERDASTPRALLFREGLLPYAEVTAGSRRLCQAVRRSALIALLGSISGTLLAFYLSFLGAYDLLTPLALELFLLLWTLPVLLLADWTRRC